MIRSFSGFGPTRRHSHPTSKRFVPNGKGAALQLIRTQKDPLNQLLALTKAVWTRSSLLTGWMKKLLEMKPGPTGI